MALSIHKKQCNHPVIVNLFDLVALRLSDLNNLYLHQPTAINIVGNVTNFISYAL